MKSLSKTVLVSFIASVGLASAVSVLAAKSGMLAQPPVINLDAPGVEVSLHTQTPLRTVLRELCVPEGEDDPVDVPVEEQVHVYLLDSEGDLFSDLPRRLLADGLGHMIIRLEWTDWLDPDGADPDPATGAGEFWYDATIDIDGDCEADESDGFTYSVFIR